MKQLNLLVLFGGVSTEHKVSCVSAASVLQHLDAEKYNILPVGITDKGRWFFYRTCDLDDMKNGNWETDVTNVPCALSPSRGDGLIVFGQDKVEKIRIDCAFPVLHGANGEDGTMQGLFEIAGIPYVGPGVGPSADSMDKSITKLLVSPSGVRQADYILATAYEINTDPAGLADRVEDKFAYPVFVKPCSSGSSVGVGKAKDRLSLVSALQEAAQFDKKVLIEQAIVGSEIEVAVLGNDHPIASIPGEVVPCREFYSYEAKYTDDKSELYIPARLSEDVIERVREAALTVYKVLGCRGMSRVDFFVTKEKDVIFNEITTLPGFTSISMYPKMFEASGIPYSELLDRLIALALESKKENL